MSYFGLGEGAPEVLGRGKRRTGQCSRKRAPGLRHTRAMHKIELAYALAAERHAAPRLRNALIELLAAVRASGSISGAAKRPGLSYRPGWGELTG